MRLIARVLVLGLVMAFPVAAGGLAPSFLARPASPEAGRQTSATDPYVAVRNRMVVEQIEARGIRAPAVLEAMRRVPRHLFVPSGLEHAAYEDRPLGIGLGQTISQPFIVAYMTEALQTASDQAVLEIGTGSGYQAAVLSVLVREVYSIEIVPELAERARRTLAANGHTNVTVRTGNGYLGWPERAPFARIIVTAAPPEIPRALVDQLAIGGIMVVPVGTTVQQLTIVTKTKRGVAEQRTIPVRFVPMVDTVR